jgi:hypothetical protein
MKTILVIYLIALIQMLSACQKAEPETYLIPSAFKGKVNIIFNQNGIPVKYKNESESDIVYTPQMGIPVKYENGRRIYEIPSDGLLLTQFKDNYGVIDRQYYSVDSEGKRIPLEIFKYEYGSDGTIKWIVKDKNTKGVFLDGTSVSYGNMNIPAQEFIISSYTNLDSFYTKEYRNNFDDKLDKATGLKLYLK